MRFTCTNIFDDLNTFVGTRPKKRRITYSTNTSTLLALYKKGEGIPGWPWPEEVSRIEVYEKYSYPKNDRGYWSWRDLTFALVFYENGDIRCYNNDARQGTDKMQYYAVKYDFGGLKDKEKGDIRTNDNIAPLPAPYTYVEEMQKADPTKELTYPFLDVVFGLTIDHWTVTDLQHAYEKAADRYFIKPRRS